MSRIRRTSAGSVGSGNGRRGTPAAPRPERSRRRGGSRGRGSKPGGRGGRGADDELFARSGVGSAPGSNAFVRDRGTSVRRLLMRLRDLRLRAGSRDGATGAAPGLQGDGARGPLAVIPGCPRSYPNSPGRTRMPAVVPWTSPKVRPGTGRYDRASPRTTARAHVRPREPTYDRATLWAAAELGSSRGSSDARLTHPGSDPPPRDASQIVTRTAQRRRSDLSVAPSREVPGGRHGRAPGASRRWLPSHGIPGPRDAEAGRPERRSPRRPHPGPGTRRREQVVMPPIDVGPRLPEARRRDAAPS